MKLADAQIIKRIDALSMSEYGISGLQLMENAGRGLACSVEKALRKTGGLRAAVFAGKGNNGGDGFVAARHLKNAGFEAAVYLLAGPSTIKGDAGANLRTWKKMGGAIFTIASGRDLKKHLSAIRHSSVIVDAIFGTGLSSPVKGVYADAIDLINSLGRFVVSADVPSGIDSSSGAVHGRAVKADVTATMAMPKVGLYLYPGRGLAGEIEVVDIGTPRALIDDEGIRISLITGADLRRILKPRARDSHKGTYGHLLVLAGSAGKTGAAYMAAMGAMRIGAGLATIGLPESLNPIMEAKTVEAMTLALPETPQKTLGAASFEVIERALALKSALVIGPGIGVSRDTAGLIEKIVLTAGLPMVLDADGLNCLAGRVDVMKRSGARLVITPHPGEAARLLGNTASDVQRDRCSSARRLADITGAVVVLKGASTVVAAPDGRVYINPAGNPGMATAGTGDVLAGMIGGLLANGYGGLDAALSAVYVHGLAGDEVKIAQGEAGMIATDLLPRLPAIMNSFLTAPVDGNG